MVAGTPNLDAVRQQIAAGFSLDMQVSLASSRSKRWPASPAPRRIVATSERRSRYHLDVSDRLRRCDAVALGVHPNPHRALAYGRSSGLVMQAIGLALRACSMCTPAPPIRGPSDPQTDSLVDAGPYRLVRHPRIPGSPPTWAGFALTSRSIPVILLAAALLGRAYHNASLDRRNRSSESCPTIPITCSAPESLSNSSGDARNLAGRGLVDRLGHRKPPASPAALAEVGAADERLPAAPGSFLSVAAGAVQPAGGGVQSPQPTARRATRRRTSPPSMSRCPTVRSPTGRGCPAVGGEELPGAISCPHAWQ